VQAGRSTGKWAQHINQEAKIFCQCFIVKFRQILINNKAVKQINSLQILSAGFFILERDGYD
jgi:hypothetical protein